MRKQAIQLLMAFAAVCSLSTALKAQSYAVQVHVPFAFHAANQVMEPGDYILSNGHNNTVQEIRAVTHGGARALRTGVLNLESKGGARAIFNVYGDQAYLSRVWTGDGEGFALPASKEEKAAREMAAVKPETLTILAEVR